MSRYPRVLSHGLLLLVGLASVAVASSTTTYLDRYLKAPPTEATAAGRHDLDSSLEDLSPQARRLWVGFNEGVIKGLEKRLEQPDLDLEVRLDSELILRQARREVFEHQVLRRPDLARHSHDTCRCVRTAHDGARSVTEHHRYDAVSGPGS